MLQYNIGFLSYSCHCHHCHHCHHNLFLLPRLLFFLLLKIQNFKRFPTSVIFYGLLFCKFCAILSELIFFNRVFFWWNFQFANLWGFGVCFYRPDWIFCWCLKLTAWRTHKEYHMKTLNLKFSFLPTLNRKSSGKFKMAVICWTLCI